MSGRNMAEDLAFLERLGEVTIDGGLVRERTLSDGTSWLQRVHQRLFDIDIPERNTEKSKQGGELGAVVAYFMLLKVSTWGLLVGLIRRPKVLVFSVDKKSDKKTRGDFRIHHVYKTLAELGYSYQELFHTTINSSLYGRYVGRGRFAMYLEALDGLWFFGRWCTGFFRKKSSHIFGNLPEDEDEARAMVSLLEKYLAVDGLYTFRVQVLSWVLKTIGYQSIIGIDDVRHYHELMSAAKQAGITTAAVQHGHFTKYHVGWRALGTSGPYARADVLLVWSEYWKRQLHTLGSVYGDDVVVAGGGASTNISFAPAKDELTVLVPFETIAPLEEVRECLTALTACEGVSVLVKGRPDWEVGKQQELYGGLPVVISLEDIPKPDVCLGVYSTFLYDMYAAGIPVGVLETSMDYGYGMIEGGLAAHISKKNICEAVRSLADSSVTPARLCTGVSFTEMVAKVLG